MTHVPAVCGCLLPVASRHGSCRRVGAYGGDHWLLMAVRGHLRGKFLMRGHDDLFAWGYWQLRMVAVARDGQAESPSRWPSWPGQVPVSLRVPSAVPPSITALISANMVRTDLRRAGFPSSSAAYRWA